MGIAKSGPKPLGELGFWSRVDVRGDDDCWLWTGPVHSHGYARVSYYGRRVLGHRLAYALTHGIPIDDLPPYRELQLDHLCRTRLCVNPAHLEMVSQRENILRGISPAAQHAKKTHCPRGHQYTKENTSMWRNQRRCKTCHRNQVAAARNGHTQEWA